MAESKPMGTKLYALLLALALALLAVPSFAFAVEGGDYAKLQGWQVQSDPVDISGYSSQLKKFDTTWGYTGADLENINAALSLQNDDKEALVEGTDYSVTFTRTADGEGNPVTESAAAYAKELGTYKMTVAGIGAYTGSFNFDLTVAPYLTVYKQVGDTDPEVAHVFASKADFEALKRAADTDPVSAIFYKSGLNVSTATEYVRLDDVIEAAGLASEWTDEAAVNYGGDARQGKAANVFTKQEMESLKFYPKATNATSSEEGAVDSPFVFALKEYSGKAADETQSALDIQQANVAKANANNAPRAMLGTNSADYQAREGSGTAAGKRLWNNVTSITIKVPATDISGYGSQLGKLDVNWGYTGDSITGINSGVSLKNGDDKLKEGTDYTISFTRVKDADGAAVTEAAADYPKELGTYTMTVTGIGAYAGSFDFTINVVPYLTVYAQVGDGDLVEACVFKSKADFEALKRSADTDPVSAIFFKGGAMNVDTATEYVRLDDVIEAAGLVDAWTDNASILYGGDVRQGKAGNEFTKAQLSSAKFFPKAAATSSWVSTSTEGAVDAPFVFALKEFSSVASEGQTAADVQQSNVAKANANNAPRTVFGSLEDEYTDPAQSGKTVAGKRLWNNVTNIIIKVPITDVSTAAVVTPEKASYVYTGKAIEPVVSVSYDGAALTEGVDYTLAYANNTNVGTATATATFQGKYTGTAQANYKIIAAATTITAANKSVAMGKTASLSAKASSGATLSYASSNAKVAKVASNGKVTPVKVGSANITIKAAAKGNYAAATKTIKVTVTKGANTLTAKGKTATVAAGKSVAIAKGITAKNAKGKLTYVKKSGNAKITVKNGKITVKKGLKKGTYTIKVNVKAAGNANWKAKTVKNVAVKVKVK